MGVVGLCDLLPSGGIDQAGGVGADPHHHSGVGANRLADDPDAVPAHHRSINVDRISPSVGASRRAPPRWARTVALSGLSVFFSQ